MKIYHYTTIETLEHILKEKTLKFNSLKNVDDSLEAISNDSGDLSNNFFVSCWTKQKKENISLWNMFTSGVQEVRIGIDEGNIPFLPLFSLQDESNYLINNIKDLDNSEKYMIWTESENRIKDTRLIAVKYINSREKKFVTRDGHNFPVLNFDNLFCIKRKIWSPQKEVRFVIFGAKTEIKSFVGIFEEISKTRKINLGYENGDVWKKDFFLLDISMMDFNGMEIMLGPKTSDEDKTNCISLIKRYCPNYKITIKDSELRGKIRWKDNSSAKV